MHWSTGQKIRLLGYGGATAPGKSGQLRSPKPCYRSVSPVSQCTKRNNMILHTKILWQRKPELQLLFWQPLRNKLASLMLIQFTTHIEIYKHIVRQLMSGCTEERSLGCFGPKGRFCCCFRQTFLVADEARSCSQVTGVQSLDTPLDMRRCETRQGSVRRRCQILYSEEGQGTQDREPRRAAGGWGWT